MDQITPAVWRAARLALERALKLHLADPNVALIDLGLRSSSAQENPDEPELVVRVHVRKKICSRESKPNSKRRPALEISAARIGFPVEIIEAGYELHRMPPARAHAHISTLGYLPAAIPETGSWWGIVSDRKSGAEMLLTTWHTLADSRRAASSRPIYHVSPHRDAEALALCTRDAMHVNLDAAVARLVPGAGALELKAHMPEFGGVRLPQLGMEVRIANRGGAAGRITGIMGSGWQVYGKSRRLLRRVVHISPLVEGESICATGDSGAWWVDENSGCVVGLHFAGSPTTSAGLALAMPDVLQALEVDLIPSARTSLCAMAGQREMEAQPEHIKRAGQKYANVFSSRRLCAIALLFLCLPAFQRYAGEKGIHHAEGLERLRLHTAQLARMVSADSVRRQQIQKISSIIERYNGEMRSDLKFNLANEIYTMSQKYPNLSPEFICATITHESAKTWDPRVVSTAGALGLMQIMPATGRMLADSEGIAWTSAEEVLFDPFINIRLGCRYLSELVGAYSMDGGLAAYNGGARRAERWLGSGRAPGILVAETEHYVPAILKIYEEYQQLSEW